MNLREFVKSALVEIIAGVAEARMEAKAHGSTIGSDRVYGATVAAKVITDGRGRSVTTVEFDIALADASAKDTKGGIGVFLGSVGLGTQGASHDEASSHSRIKFSVNVVFPSDEPDQS